MKPNFTHCIYQLFEEQVERTPNAVAVVFEKEQLTYRELNNRSNQLAHYLQNLEVKPEVLVGICVERSLEMVVGLLGILKAGGAYVPLDPAYPEDRLAFMLSDAQIPLLLTTQGLVAHLPEHQAQVLCLDSDWETIALEREENPESRVNPDNLAYAIYTSGSTGQPKGCLIAHQNVTRLFAATQSWFHFNERDVWTLFHSYAFDFSVWELWGALLYGSRLVVVPYWISRSPREFYDLLCEQGVTVLNQTPSAFRQLIRAEEELPEAKELNLRLVIFGGEALELQSLKPWFERHGEQSPQLVNMYGITETTVHVTYRPLTLTDLNSTGSVIGVPIPDLEVYILDKNLNPVPIGVSGEMYVGGAGVARGYLNRPELTAERFIANPFRSKPDALLYKTGDLARYLANGDLEYLGRIDHQVKIRGFRIELGEIEATLRQHPQVQQAVVTAREDIPGDKRLVAYVVANSHLGKMSERELRDFLKQKLPDYMIPSAFVLLEAFPLTPNGKIDRLNLPAPANIRPRLPEDFVPPSTPTEGILAAIWGEVLGLEQIGINDNFFELGGNSLLATSIANRIRDAFSLDLPVGLLFEANTIASVSLAIDNARQAGLEEKLVSSMAFDNLEPIVSEPRDTLIPVSFEQESLWLVVQSEPESYIYNCPLALRLTGKLSLLGLEQSINEMIHRHEILRTTFSRKEGQLVQVIAPSLSLPLAIVDLQNLPPAEREAEAKRFCERQRKQIFDLASGPLLQVVLLKLAADEHWLLITMHHIITDSWSINIFLQELRKLYNAFCNNLPSPLPEVSVQYADFAIWQRQWSHQQLLDKQLSYWQKKLANIDPPLNFLPINNKSKCRSALFYSFALPQSLVVSIKTLSHLQKATIFVILLTALKILLFKSSGQTDVIVLTPTANRRIASTERMLGFFMNEAYLRSLIDLEQTGLSFLEQVKQTVNEALDNQEIPLDRLFDSISNLDSVSSMTLNMEPTLNWQEKFGECEVTSLPNERVVSIPDLTIDEDFPIAIFVYCEGDSQIEIDVLYSTELFRKETITSIFRYYQEILVELTEHPETKIYEFKEYPTAI